MKIKVAFTVDIDAESWANEFGLARSEVRADVQEHLRQSVLSMVASQGLLADEDNNREWS